MTEIDQWLRTGAGVQEGLRLLSLYRPNVWLARMVERHPTKYRPLLERTLSGTGREQVAEAASGDGRFRERWPFLGDDDCPMELKILAADKITAWTNYAAEHEKLYSCVSMDECLEIAKQCVFFYCQNRRIFSEFAYYKEHRQILGKHEIFAEVRHLRELRTAGILTLVRRQSLLRDSVWRLRKLLRTGDRPDLCGARTELLLSRERELAEVTKMVDEYEKSYGKYDDTRS